MDQPLWQNWLNMIFLALAVRPAAIALALSPEHPALRFGYIGVCVACGIAAIALWGKRAWVIGSLALVGFASALATLLTLALGASSVKAAWLLQLLFVLAGAAGLIALARRAEPEDHARS